jgi:O-antigen/teichoic acid export membrane protein
MRSPRGENTRPFPMRGPVHPTVDPAVPAVLPDPGTSARPREGAKLACVILAYNDTVQVRRLIDALEPFPVFLHCDANTSPEVFAEMIADLPERVTVMDRHKTGWATWGGVEAELAGFRAALATTDATHIAMLAGSDYPLATSAEITAILDGYLGKTIAMVHRMPNRDWGMSGGYARLRYRHWAYRKTMLRLPIPRRLPAGIVPAGAAPQKIVARHHAEAILAVADSRPDLIKFWRRGWASDETFIPTVLSTPEFVPDWPDAHEPASAWWIGWSAGTREKSPRWLAMDLEDELLSGQKYNGQPFPRLFARKFSTELSSDILRVIEGRRTHSAFDAVSADVLPEGVPTLEYAAAYSGRGPGAEGQAHDGRRSEGTPTPPAHGWTGYDAAIAEELARTADRRQGRTARHDPPLDATAAVSAVTAATAGAAVPDRPIPRETHTGAPARAGEGSGDDDSHNRRTDPGNAPDDPGDRDDRDGGMGPPTGAAATVAPSSGSGLFGRGLLYVVVWALQLIAGTVVSPILAYALGPPEFGTLASAIALHQVLGVLALLGIDQALVLQRAEDPSGKTARGLVTVGIAISFGITGLLTLTGALWSPLLGFEGFNSLVLAVILWTAPGAVIQVTLALLVAEDRLRAFTWVSALSAVGGQLVGLVLLFTVHNDATTYAWGGVVSQFLAMFIGIALTRPVLRGLIDWTIAWKAIRLGVPLAISGLAYFVLNAGDRIVIQRLLGPSEVGRYQVAYTVGYTVVLLLTFTSSAWLPRFAAVRDDAERWLLSSQSRDELYRLLIPVVLAVTLAAPVALRIVAPPSFEPDTLLVVVFLVALSAYPVAAGGATGRLLITLRRGRTMAVITVIAALVNIALNLLLVPAFGIAGSAAATVIAFVVTAVLQRRALPATPVWQGAPPVLLWAVVASTAVAAASTLLPQTDFWNIAKFVVAVACLPWFLVVLRRARLGPVER